MSAAPHGPLRNYTVLSNPAWVEIKTSHKHSQLCSTYIKHQMKTQTTTMKATSGHKGARQWMLKTSERTAGCGGLSCCEEHKEDGGTSKRWWDERTGWSGGGRRGCGPTSSTIELLMRDVTWNRTVFDIWVRKRWVTHRCFQ